MVVAGNVSNESSAWACLLAGFLAQIRAASRAANRTFDEYGMDLSTQTEVGKTRRPASALARLLDVLLIVGGAVIAARTHGEPEHAGYDSALVAFTLLFAVMLFPAFDTHRGARRYLWLC